jgi:hypothetical protein
LHSLPNKTTAASEAADSSFTFMPVNMKPPIHSSYKKQAIQQFIIQILCWSRIDNQFLRLILPEWLYIDRLNRNFN